MYMCEEKDNIKDKTHSRTNLSPIFDSASTLELPGLTGPLVRDEPQTNTPGHTKTLRTHLVLK